MTVRRKSKSEPEIPTASMADIAFLLIIFFLVTTNFLKEKGLLLELPNTEKSDEAKDVKKQNAELNVSKKGFLLNSKPVAYEQLLTELHRLLAGAASDADRIVILRADRDATYEQFIMAEDILQQTGEEFVDFNKNGKWDEGERYTDANGNKKFDPGAITTIELLDTSEGSVVKKEEIKKVDVHGEIEGKMKDKEEEDSDEPPAGLTDGPGGPDSGEKPPGPGRKR
jgi:biopolymer transport protein ExbD